MKRVRLLLVAFLAVSFLGCNKKAAEYQFLQGFALGTYYNIKYQNIHDKNYGQDIDSLLLQFENSLSTFKPNSVISRVNSNDTAVILDDWFINCFNKAVEISGKTDGAFDPTVAPVVNAWGFGFTKRSEVDSAYIDSLLIYVGMDKIRLSDNRIYKSHPNIMLDASAIAKGYAVDIVSEFFVEKGIENYLVEIGGEVRANGVNPKSDVWKVGIDKPIEDHGAMNRQLQDIVVLRERALATSGNYRQFYVKDGVKYSHTIDPRTGYPVRHNLLSATVLADDCMTADAYATAFMVLGLEKSMEIVENDPSLEGYFIYADEDGSYKVSFTEGIGKLIQKH